MEHEIQVKRHILKSLISFLEKLSNDVTEYPQDVILFILW